MSNFKQTFKKHQHIIINSLVIGVVVGLLIFAAIRFFTYKPPNHTHYHANFAVYINGQQLKFEDPANYQEVVSCIKDDETNPLHRAHMHDGIYDVIHVHADAVTWNQFFENLNMTTDPTYLRIKNDSFINNSPSKATYILNGKKIVSLSGLVISSRDKLLINYGPDDDNVITQRYEAITDKAKNYNEKLDPASCSGELTNGFSDRLNNIFR